MQFIRSLQNPVLVPDQNKSYEKAAVYNPCAAVYKNKIYLVYRAEGAYYDKYISSLCLAMSEDGVHFKKYKNNPIILPTLKEEKRGCEDPRIIKIGNIFYLTYTAYSGKQVNVCLATSTDLVRWKKHGIILRQAKSAQILEQKINGEFIMLVGDKSIRLAKSKNLIDWKLSKAPFLTARKNNFDNFLVETGPAPLEHKNQLILIYNSADKSGVYHLGYCLLDKNNPAKILHRHNRPLAGPAAFYELYGKVNYVIFAAALIKFKNKFLVYYGAADKTIGLAQLKP